MNKLQEAKNYIISRVFEPASNSEVVSERIKNIISNQRPWINSFMKIGDLYHYLNHITSKDGDNEIYQQLTILKLNTYESVLSEFKVLFKDYLSDRTVIKDFDIGREYSARELLSPIGKYDTRCGGIQLNKTNGSVKEIVIKATLNNGKYPNQWLSEDKILKYYLKSVTRNNTSTFSEEYEDNSAVINSGNLPIHAFVRSLNKGPFIYKGVFTYLNHITDLDGKMWFQLASSDAPEAQSEFKYHENLSVKVKKSLADNSIERKKRLKKAARKPKSRVVSTTVYDRNPDVVAEVLEQANGECGSCGNDAPFKRKSDNTPYLEVHHKVRLADGGNDTVENAIALCPNCHRKQHYG